MRQGKDEVPSLYGIHGKLYAGRFSGGRGIAGTSNLLTFPAQFFPAGLLTGRCGVPGKLHCQAEGQSLKAQYRFLGSFE